MQTAIVETRTQSAKGAYPASGPDVYVAVQVVPFGAEPLKTLNRKTAEKRGIEIRYIGEGYSNRSGPRSAFGKALKAANELAAEINGTN